MNLFPGGIIVGIVAAVLLVNRIGSIRLQVVGFIGCAVGLAIAAFSSAFAGATQTAMIFAGFMLFNFMTNMGPNAQTYLLAGEVFPTHIRGYGAGFVYFWIVRRTLLTGWGSRTLPWWVDLLGVCPRGGTRLGPELPHR